MAIDAALGRLGIKEGVCTSSTRPANPFEGQLIYETDTNRTLVYDNAAWLVVADNQVLSIDTTNSRVGVGTTTPSIELDVNGSIATTGGTTNNRGILLAHQNNINYSYVGRSEGGAPDVGNRLGWDYDNDNFDIKTGGDSRLTIDSSGNVGINDTTPSYTLDVNGDINATGALRIGGTAIGEWTTFTTSAANATISGQACQYVRVNDWVYAAYYVQFSGVTGNLTLTPPPVTGINSDPWNRVGVVGGGFVRIGTTQYVISPYFTGSGGTLNIYYTPNGAVASFVNASTPGAGVSQLRMNLIYRAA